MRYNVHEKREKELELNQNFTFIFWLINEERNLLKNLNMIKIKESFCSKNERTFLM